MFNCLWPFYSARLLSVRVRLSKYQSVDLSICLCIYHLSFTTNKPSDLATVSFFLSFYLASYCYALLSGSLSCILSVFLTYDRSPSISLQYICSWFHIIYLEVCLSLYIYVYIYVCTRLVYIWAFIALHLSYYNTFYLLYKCISHYLWFPRCICA